MNTERDLRADAEEIIAGAIREVMPGPAVKKALAGRHFGGKVILVAAGKAAWQMANAALQCLETPPAAGIVLTKYGHAEGPLPGIECREAGHPVPDENSFLGTQRALELVTGLSADDTVLFLLSGGGSALFEVPLVAPETLQSITQQLLACGADIREINTVRKRLSAVKGGKFALRCAPAHVFSIVLSDVLGDPLDMIASGPTWPDSSTCAQAEAVVRKYNISLPEEALPLLRVETPKELNNVEAHITGSVKELCAAAARKCAELGYVPVILTDALTCEAREAGRSLAAALKARAAEGKSIALIVGGETVVHLTGKGKGGRNQELALAAAEGISGCRGCAVFSVGSDGTDGPTDAAGGYVDDLTLTKLAEQGLRLEDVLAENDAYHALEKTGGLLITGPTGTNVNDVSVALCRAE